jgi:hypothetical protein
VRWSLQEKLQKVFVEVFLAGGPLSIWRVVYVDLSRRPGGAVSYANSGEWPHFVATETAAVPSSPTKGSRQQKEACCRAVSNENPAGVSEEGKNCSLHFSPLQFLHPMKQVAVRKEEG